MPTQIDMFSSPGLRLEDLKSDEWIFASVSGGRSSEYMRWILGQHHDPEKIITLFANTAREDPRTLDFVKACDDQLGFRTVWLEAVVHPEPNKGTTHRVVTYETASRDGEPFEAVISLSEDNKHCSASAREICIAFGRAFMAAANESPSDRSRALYNRIALLEYLLRVACEQLHHGDVVLKKAGLK